MDQCFFHKRAFYFRNIRTMVVAKRRKELMIDANNSSAPQPHPQKNKSSYRIRRIVLTAEHDFT